MYIHFIQLRCILINYIYSFGQAKHKILSAKPISIYLKMARKQMNKIGGDKTTCLTLKDTYSVN